MASSFVSHRGQLNIVDGTTRYMPLGGANRVATTEAEHETPVREAGTFSNLYVYVSVNSVSVNTVCTLRKSAAGTALTVTYAADQTGIKEDTANSVSYANTDKCCLEIAAGSEAGTNNFYCESWAVQFDPTSGGNCVTFMTCNAGISYTTASTTNYLNPCGTAGTPTSTEANHKAKIRGAFTSSNLYGYVTANARTTDTTVKTRVNGADGSQSITWTSTQTGAKEDITHTDSLVSGDDYNYAVVTSTGSSAFQFSLFATQLLGTAGVFGMHARNASATSVAFAVTTYLGVRGSFSTNTTEASTRVRPQLAFTASDFDVYVSANTLDANCVITVRDGGADSSITVTYSTGQTGLKTDSSNSAAITGATDYVAVKFDTTSSASGSISVMGMSLQGSTSSPQTMTPSTSTVTLSGPSTTVAHVLTETPDAATETTSAPSVSVSHLLSETPSVATVSLSAPSVTLVTGDYLTPDAATVASTPAGSVTLAFGGTNRHVVGPPRVAMSAPNPTLAFGGISVTPDTATVTASAPSATVAFGDAVRGVDAAVVSVACPDAAVVHGVATFATDANSLSLTAPDLNLAIDRVLTPDVATATTSPAAASVVPGTKTVAPDPATVVAAAPAATIALALTIEAAAQTLTVAPADADALARNYVIRVDTQTVSLLAGHVVQVRARTIAAGSPSITVQAPDPTVLLGPLTMTPDAAEIALSLGSLPQSYEPQTSVMAEIVYCAVAYDVTVCCIVSGLVDAFCTVVPDETATTTKGAFPPILPEEPVAI